MPRLLIVAILALGCVDGRLPASGRTSPFALFGRNDLRAGLPYRALEDAARKESSQPPQCLPLWARARRCAMRIEPGSLDAVVDSTGRIVRLTVTADENILSGRNVHGQLVLRDALHAMQAAWDSVVPPAPDETDASPGGRNWRTGRWGAAVWRDPIRLVSGAGRVVRTDAELAISLPDSFGVTDLPAYSLLLQLRPPKPVRRGPSMMAVAPPPPAPTSEQLLALMRSDLRELTIMQETAFHNTGRYERTLDQLRVSPSGGVRVQLLSANDDGWSGTATHPSLPGWSCVVYAGIIVDPPRTRAHGRRGAPGEIACDES
jgi:hypothetical protein